MKIFCLILSLFFSMHVYSVEKVGKGLEIERKFRNLGTIKIGTIIKERFYIKNSTSRSVQIKYVNPECICTDFYVSSYEIKPNSSIYIDLKIDTQKKNGLYTLYTIIRADTQPEMYKLALKMNISE